jgi:hypothetical protein
MLDILTKMGENGRRPQTKMEDYLKKMEDDLEQNNNKRRPKKKYNERRAQATLKKSTLKGGCSTKLSFT